MGISTIVLRAGMAVALAANTATPLAAQDSTPSSGVFKTAQQLYDVCTSSSEAELDYCDWFIMGAHDMMKFYGDTGAGGSTICIPIGTEELAVRNMVIAYWRSGRTSLSYSAVSTIYNALVETYPC